MVCEENACGDFQLIFSMDSMCTTDGVLSQCIGCYQSIGFGVKLRRLFFAFAFVYGYAISMLSSVKVRADFDGQGGKTACAWY